MRRHDDPARRGGFTLIELLVVIARHHIGRRGVEEIVETVFEVPTSLGSVSALEGETSAALASPYQRGSGGGP